MSVLAEDDFQLELTTALTPAEAFATIQRVGDWWHPLVAGGNDAVGDVFSVSPRGAEPCSLRVAQLVPGRRIVWRVLAGSPDPGPWADTDLTFELDPGEDVTNVRFVHVGLLPDDPGYQEATAGWKRAVNTRLRRRLLA